MIELKSADNSKGVQDSSVLMLTASSQSRSFRDFAYKDKKSLYSKWKRVGAMGLTSLLSVGGLAYFWDYLGRTKNWRSDPIEVKRVIGSQGGEVDSDAQSPLRKDEMNVALLIGGIFAICVLGVTAYKHFALNFAHQVPVGEKGKKKLDLFRNSLCLLKRSFLASLTSNFELISLDMPSKLADKSAQKSHALTSKANFERGLLKEREATMGSSHGGKKLEEKTNEFQRLLSDPYGLFREIKEKKTSSGFDIALMFLSVCPCKKMTSSLRVQLENSSIELLRDTHSLDDPITIVSIGPGGCFQELVYLAKIVDSGFKTIKLILIDPKDLMIGAFAEFCEKHFVTSIIDIVKYDKIEKYVQEADKNLNLRPDLFLLIDLVDDKYKVENKKLTDYSFDLLKNTILVENKTVIAYSTFTAQRTQLISKAISCVYDGGDSLANIILKRKEFDCVEERERRVADPTPGLPEKQKKETSTPSGSIGSKHPFSDNCLQFY